jgi:DNA-binding Xre family transcriptional regulator
MALSYNRLWKLLIDKNMNKNDLKNMSGLNSATIAKLGKNKRVSMAVMEKLCSSLNCDFSELFEFIEDDVKSIG